MRTTTVSTLRTALNSLCRNAFSPFGLAPEITQSLIPDPEREALEHDTAIALCTNVMRTGISSDDEHTIDRAYDLFRNSMMEYQDDTLRRMKIAARTELGSDLMRMVSYDKRTEEYVRDWLAFEPYKREHDLPRIQGMLLALDQFPHLAPQSQEEKRYEQIMAIIRVTVHFNLDNEKVSVARSGAFKNARLFIADEGIRTFITTNENPCVVADIIISRNLTDHEQIAVLLATMNESETVLSTGVL